MFLRELSAVIREGQEAEIAEAVASFSCKDKDVEQFLKTKAIEHERRNKSRTYIIFDEAGSDGKLRVLAYFTLSLKILTFGATVSKTSVKEIDGFNKNAKAVPLFLVGQFGKDEFAAKEISGEYIMALCIFRLQRAQTIVGGRIVLAECLPIAPVIEFYKRNGFTFLQTDENDKYHQMICVI
jgi:hypothetical protein